MRARERICQPAKGPILVAILAGLFALVLAAFLAPTGHAQTGPGDNMNYRTRAFLKQMRACQTATGLAIEIVREKPNDLIGASQTVNQAKSICNAIRNRMTTMDTRHFSDQALDGEVAVDYWSRGLGRFSNYIDDGRPSDVTKAASYFATARSEAAICLHGINTRRAVYGLPPLK